MAQAGTGHGKPLDLTRGDHHRFRWWGDEQTLGLGHQATAVGDRRSVRHTRSVCRWSAGFHCRRVRGRDLRHAGVRRRAAPGETMSRIVDSEKRQSLDNHLLWKIRQLDRDAKRGDALAWTSVRALLRIIRRLEANQR